MLTDLEYRVWTQYLLSADDFGVMRATAAKLQSDNAHLHNRPAKMLMRCIEAMVTSGLVRTFTDQEQRFIFSHNWQTYQKVEYPRATDNPKPSGDEMDGCDEATRLLFLKHPGGLRARNARPKDLERTSQMNSDNVPTTRAGAPAKRLTANANGQRLEAEEERFDLTFPAFRDTYPESRRKGGWGCQTAFMDEAKKAGGSAVLMAALENHLASEQWSDPKLIPGMDVWLSEERWRQRLPAKGVAAQARSNMPQWLQDAKAARKAAGLQP